MTSRCRRAKSAVWGSLNLEQRQCRLLHRQVFRVHQRHQPELPPRLLWLGLQPAPLHRLQTLSQSLGIAREGHGSVAPDLAGELVEQQYQRQIPGRRSAPGVELAGEGLPGQPEEAIPHQPVEGSVLGEPLARPGFAKPEGENLAGLVPLARHHSSACTLATLSSSV
jgi:hypothetical protein